MANGTELKPVLKPASGTGPGVRFRPREDDRATPPDTIKEERSVEEEEEEEEEGEENFDESQELLENSPPEINLEQDDSVKNEENAIDIPPDTIPEEDDEDDYKKEDEEGEENREFRNPMFIEDVDNPTKDNDLSQKLLSKPDETDVSKDSSDQEPDLKLRYRPLKNLFPVTKISPVFLSEGQRMFLNPISYLGGPRIPPDKTTLHPSKSKESIVSVD